MLSWNPRDFLVAFRRWHRDSSLIHLNVLTLLEDDGSASMGELAQALDVSVASMTGIADRMERRGLVERRRDETDRRRVVVQATEAGRDVFRQIADRRREALGKLLAQLDQGELEGLLLGHRALHQARVRAFGAGERFPPRLHDRSTSGGDDPAMHPRTSRP